MLFSIVAKLYLEYMKYSYTETFFKKKKHFPET